MWLVLSDDKLIQFPQFDAAFEFAEELSEEETTVIDTRKRVISIVQPEAFAFQESA